MDDFSNESVSTSVAPEKSNTPLIIGGAVVLAAAAGYYFYTKKKDADATQLAARKIDAPAKPLGGDPLSKPPVVAAPPVVDAKPVVVAPPVVNAPPVADTVVFNDSPAANKNAIWKVLMMFPLATSDGTFYTLSQTPATTAADSGASFLAQKDQAAPGSVYVLMNPENASFVLVDRGTAVSQASGTSPSWTLFLKPGEWQAVAAQAAADTVAEASPGNVPTPAQLPSGGDFAAMQAYLAQLTGK
jgi:LPXTG-motif cell wall-anchored protein